eukprot:SAG11_NODE_851_length_6875_cov_8.193034_8_plen_46_part_00
MHKSRGFSRRATAFVGANDARAALFLTSPVLERLEAAEKLPLGYP